MRETKENPNQIIENERRDLNISEHVQDQSNIKDDFFHQMNSEKMELIDSSLEPKNSEESQTVEKEHIPKHF